MAAFIIKWILEEEINENQAVALLTEILVQVSSKIPIQLSR